MTAPDDTVDRCALRALTRRHFFRRSGLGIGSLALLRLLDDDSLLPLFFQRTQHMEAVTVSEAQVQHLLPR